MDQPRPPSYGFVFGVVLVLSVGIAAAGGYLAYRGQGWTMLSAGAACVVATLLVWAVVATIHSTREFMAARLAALLGPVGERLEQFSVMLNLISEQQLLSDRGKSIVYRNKDREALRLAIQDEISRGDFEAALKLAAEMDNSFGNRAEAEKFRKIVEDRRSESIRRQVNDAMVQIDKHIRSEQWQLAQREAEQVAQRFPEDEQARSLPAEIERRRAAHKQQLIDSFHDAANRRDVDGAMELLKRLDAYLSPGEAESLQETARSIVRAKLELLREQFAAAVHETRWHDALRLGDVIMRDFPNSQMAREVGEVIGTLRQRAGEPAGV